MAGQRLSLSDYVPAFSRPFWAANVSELFERIAYYGMAPVLVPYLVQVRNFDETAAIRVGGNLGFIVYGLTIPAHFYKYLGSLAPAGQEGMYLGFAFLPIALGSLIAGGIGGPVAAWARTSLHHPEKMFWAFGAVALVAALGLWLHAKLYAARDARA